MCSFRMLLLPSACVACCINIALKLQLNAKVLNKFAPFATGRKKMNKVACLTGSSEMQISPSPHSSHTVASSILVWFWRTHQ